MSAPTTVIVVRHAEAGRSGEDPPLTEAGRARAKALAETLKHAGVAAVFVTNYARTKETAGRVVAATKVPVIVVDAQDYRTLLHKLFARYTSRTVLVVGHNNTVPEIVKELSGFDVPAIALEDHSRMFVITIDDDRKTVIASQYGCAP